MDLKIPNDLANMLSIYEDKGWTFRYAKSINHSYPNKVVLYFTIPNQPPRFERFQKDDPRLVHKITDFLARTQVLAHEAHRPLVEA